MKYKEGSVRRNNKKRLWIILAVVTAVSALAIVYMFVINKSTDQKNENLLIFDDTVTANEQYNLGEAIKHQNIELTESVNVSAKTTDSITAEDNVVETYVPVTGFYTTKQSISKVELKKSKVVMVTHGDTEADTEIASFFGVDLTANAIQEQIPETINDQIILIPNTMLDSSVKLLTYNDAYYLDNLNSGAVFRSLEFSGDGASQLDGVFANGGMADENIYKVNMTGVTALTRLMMRKLSSVQDPKYFSAKIGEFLADADLTHVSNEVSFQKGCQYSNTSFCSPPEFIETLKDSGVDLVELTGNHNNDRGNLYNTESIELYHSLGMSTFGGGLNEVEAAKPHIADTKGSKVAFIGYNMADGQGSGAIAGTTTAGANFYTDTKAESDIKSAKENSDFVIVNIQYAECQAYPNGYVEFPECDGPIFGQEADFKKMIDYGADMVIGSSAHQPQTYELYKGKPIYYGLGNLYFEQTQWPGTERGLILTHYFNEGELIQTKITPTVYDIDYQTRIMTDEEADYLLTRLNNAR